MRNSKAILIILIFISSISIYFHYLNFQSFKIQGEFLEDIRLGTINTEAEKRAEELNQLDIYYDDLIQKAINYEKKIKQYLVNYKIWHRKIFNKKF